MPCKPSIIVETKTKKNSQNQLKLFPTNNTVYNFAFIKICYVFVSFLCLLMLRLFDQKVKLLNIIAI